MAILESIKYQLLSLKNCDTDPMQWKRRSGHKGLLDINATLQKIGGNIQDQNSNSKKQTMAQHNISQKQV
jgi:hypothetical protein